MYFLLISLLLGGLLQAQTQRMMTTAPPQSAGPDEPQPVATEAEPDVLMRGRTTTIVVTGNDAAALKTFGVNPSTGITIGPIKELPARADGVHAVSVAVTVDNAAAPGEREIILVVAPVLSTTNATRSADDPMTKQMEQAFQLIMKQNTKPEPMGTIYVNSHELTITSLTVDKASVRVAVSDPAGDVEPRAPQALPAIPSSGAIITLPSSSERLVQSEARCGRDIFDSVLDDEAIRERQGSTAVIVATLDSMAIDGQRGCELRVRVRDAAGNVSRWSAARIE